jgi:protein-L-isoaspartate(D-aspartate) O-methyltransferase
VRLAPLGTALAASALAGLLAAAASCAPPLAESDTFRARRHALADAIAASGVRDSATLAAIRAVPRHAFVRRQDWPYAYEDRPLPIGEGQTISQPFVVAFMTEAVRARPAMKVLEVGTGSGYQAAVLAEIGCRVYTIEIIRSLADSARVRLERLGYRGVDVRHGDGYQGWPQVAPFDAIMLTAAPDSLPAALVEQLAPGGRIVAPIGAEGEVQSLVLVEKDAAGRTSTRHLLPVRFVPMRKGLR